MMMTMKDLIKLKKDKNIYQIYAVTDRYWLNGRKLEDDVLKAIQGGATIIQLREKNMSDDEFIQEAFKIKNICDEYDIPFIINDNLNVMLAVDADGIHIGQDDADPKFVREKIGANKILGVSCQTVEEAKIAVENGADYLGIGAIFATSTKNDALIVPIDELIRINNEVDIPTVAIGGITIDNLEELRNTMIDGIAVVSAIFGQKHIKESTINLKNKYQELQFNIKNYDNFIIDYDGTILDSMCMWNKIASLFLKNKSINCSEDIDEKLSSFTSDETVDYLSLNYMKDKTKEEISKEVNDFVINEYLKQGIIPGVLGFLDRLKNKGQVILYSSTEIELLLPSLNKCGLISYFNEIISAKFSNDKINGNGYMAIIEKYGFRPERTLIIEDQLFATTGARSKGLDVMQVLTDNKIDNKAKYITNYRKGI